MYNEQLEKLIEFALADGELTEKEKQILFKRAEAEGVDLDEFEMMLEAKLHIRQKEGIDLTRKEKENVIKCPSCNDIIPALSKVCPSCSFVVNAGRKSLEAEKGLEDLISDIEDDLVKIKSLKKSNIITTLFEHSYISLPTLSIFLLAIGFRLESFISILLGVVLAFISWWVIKKKINGGKSENLKPTFNSLKATFEKHSRTAKTLFGENKKAKLLLDELNDELNVIDVKRKKGKTVEYILYGVIALMAVGVFFIPKPETEEDKEVVIREMVQQYISAGDAKKAEEYYMLHANDDGLVGYHIIDLAVTVMQALVDQNLLDEAESYLNKGHHVNTDMADVAKPLVLAYIKKDDIKSANRVISSLSEYRQEKLKKLLPEN